MARLCFTLRSLIKETAHIERVDAQRLPVASGQGARNIARIGVGWMRMRARCAASYAFQAVTSNQDCWSSRIIKGFMNDIHRGT
ncbi:hypothetical protein [Sorlinia euscelidii]|uniref:hypothetical protein n=1 Tax=Sorlinia euscelidii TaxID=3081148 RepID=UPI00374E1ECC